MTEVDVLVAGGGLGGVAAALAAAREGCRVLVAEAGDRVGGQVTAQAVSALDEHPLVELPGTTSRSYGAFREGIRAVYRRRYPAVRDVAALNPGGGWVSRLCFEPAVGQQVLEGMLTGSAGSVEVRTRAPVTALRRDGDQLTGARIAGVGEVRATVVLDATPLGDLLPLAEAPWQAGADGRGQGVQACTVPFALEHRPGEDHTIPRPDGYEALRDAQPFTLTLRDEHGRERPFRLFADGPTGLPPFWTYRRIRDGALLDPGGATTDVVLVNWEGNDHAGDGLLRPASGPDRDAVEGARQLSLAFLHWLQTEVPCDDGSGYGYPGLRLVPRATGTPDGLAAVPYVREGRRLVALRSVTEDDLAAATGSARARTQVDAVGIGWYAMDLHRRVADPTRRTRYAPTAPFQVPLAALVTETPSNLVAAGLAVGATQLAAGALRVHHLEWAVGEAAGALAAESVAGHRPPRTLAQDGAGVRAVQRRLVAAGVPLAWYTDLPWGHPAHAGAHLLAVAGVLDGDPVRCGRLEACPDDRAGGQELDGLRTAARRAGLTDPGPAEGRSWGQVCAAAARGTVSGGTS